MTKVAIKNENITSFGGIYIIFFVVFQTSPLVWVGDLMLRQVQKTPKNLISMYRVPKDISTYKIFSQEKILRN